MNQKKRTNESESKPVTADKVKKDIDDAHHKLFELCERLNDIFYDLRVLGDREQKHKILDALTKLNDVFPLLR